jgi:hypothetical protein
MIKIPFERCVILSTLNFEQLTSRLESAIYNPSLQSDLGEDRDSTHQYYYGQIRSFRFLATRIIGHKHAHLPLFLSPTIEGNIKALRNGYEISLGVNLQNITFILLLTWLGGLCSTISAIFDRAFINIEDSRYFTGIGISVLLYLVVLSYLYFLSWQTTRFFKALFVERLTGITKIGVGDRHRWIPNLPPVPVPRSTPSWMSKNPPAFSAPGQVKIIPTDNGEMFTDNSIDTDEEWIPTRTRSRSFISGKLKQIDRLSR